MKANCCCPVALGPYPSILIKGYFFTLHFFTPCFSSPPRCGLVTDEPGGANKPEPISWQHLTTCYLGGFLRPECQRCQLISFQKPPILAPPSPRVRTNHHEALFSPSLFYPLLIWYAFASQMAAVRCIDLSLCRPPPCTRVGSQPTVAPPMASRPIVTPFPATQKPS